MTTYFCLFGYFLNPKKCCRNCVDPSTKGPKRLWLCLQAKNGCGLRTHIFPLTGILTTIFEWQIKKEMISLPVKGFKQSLPSYKLLKNVSECVPTSYTHHRIIFINKLWMRCRYLLTNMHLVIFLYYQRRWYLTFERRSHDFAVRDIYNLNCHTPFFLFLN